MTSVRLLIVMLSTSTSNDLVMPLISIHLSTSANVFFQGELPRKNTFENRTLSEEPKSFPKSRDNAAPYTVSTFENGIGWKIFPMSTFEKQINLNYFLHLLLLTATTPKAQLLKNGQSRYYSCWQNGQKRFNWYWKTNKGRNCMIQRKVEK